MFGKGGNLFCPKCPAPAESGNKQQIRAGAGYLDMDFGIANIDPLNSGCGHMAVNTDLVWR